MASSKLSQDNFSSNNSYHGVSIGNETGAHKEHPLNSATQTHQFEQELQTIRPVDFLVSDEGTIWLFSPVTPAAFEFLSEHIEEDALYFGTSLAVEHRFVYDLLIGLREHGLRAARS
jgi:hypothetical protein